MCVYEIVSCDITLNMVWNQQFYLTVFVIICGNSIEAILDFILLLLQIIYAFELFFFLFIGCSYRWNKLFLACRIIIVLFM